MDQRSLLLVDQMPLLPTSSSGSELKSSEAKESKVSPLMDPRLLETSDIYKYITVPLLGLEEAKTVRLRLVSRAQAALFHDAGVLKQFKEDEKHRRLFRHLVQGEQEEVKAILDQASQDPKELVKLLTVKHTITDHAKRQFDNITLFQLALWSLDRHMWRLLLTYFNHPAVKADLRGEAYRQYQEHRSGLRPYTKELGEHYEFEEEKRGHEGLVPVLQAFSTMAETYADDYGSISDKVVAHEQWAEVGKAQRRSPLHVMQEYCRRDGLSFCGIFSETRFKEEYLPRSASFHDSERNFMTFWEGLSSGLGSTSTWAIEASWGMGSARLAPITRNTALELKACRLLAKVRMEEYEALELELRKDLEVVVDSSAEVASLRTSTSTPF